MRRFRRHASRCFSFDAVDDADALMLSASGGAAAYGAHYGAPLFDATLYALITVIAAIPR